MGVPLRTKITAIALAYPALLVWFVVYVSSTPNVPFITLVLGWLFFAPLLLLFLILLPHALSLSLTWLHLRMLVGIIPPLDFISQMHIEFGRISSSWPTCRKILPTALRNRSALLVHLGIYAEGIKLTEEALELEKAAGQYDDIATTVTELAQMYAKAGDLKTSEALADQSLTILERSFEQSKAEAPTTEGTPTETSPTETRPIETKSNLPNSYALHLFSAVTGRAELYEMRQQYDEALPLRIKNLHLFELMNLSESMQFSGFIQLGTILPLAYLYCMRTEPELAEPLMIRAVEIAEKHLSHREKGYAWAINGLGLVHLLKGDLEKAGKELNRAWSIVEKLDKKSRGQVSGFIWIRGLWKMREKNYKEAEELFKSSIADVNLMRAPNHPALLPTLSLYNNLLAEQGRNDEAARILQQIELIQKKYDIRLRAFQ